MVRAFCSAFVELLLFSAELSTVGETFLSEEGSVEEEWSEIFGLPATVFAVAEEVIEPEEGDVVDDVTEAFSMTSAVFATDDETFVTGEFAASDETFVTVEEGMVDGVAGVF